MEEDEAVTGRELSYADAAEIGFRLHTEQRLEQAEAFYRALLEIDPNDPNVTHYLGVLLHQTGRTREAIELIERSIRADDRVAAWHNNYGNVLLGVERFDDAAEAYRRCAALDPGNVEVLCNLGVLYRQLDQLDLAQTMLHRALAAQPDFALAHVNLANLLARMGRFDEALARAVEAVKLFPRDAPTRKLLGSLYAQMGRLDEAADVYRGWLADEPDNEGARHYLAGCTGVDVPERAKDAYVEGLFDGFARSFDANLAALDYRAPQLVGEAIARLTPARGKRLRVLDAGCGTGLCGPYLEPYASELIGVDLSANMIDRARARNLYDGFVKSELVAYIESAAEAFDVIVSADTLCYFGRLERVAVAARRALSVGGLLIFTVEARTEGPDYQLHAHGRYSHRGGYIRSTLDAAGFGVRELRDVILRSEGRRPVQGWLAVGEAVALPAR